MTTDRAYSLENTEGRNPQGISLYQAAKALVDAHNSDLLLPGSYIRRDRRCVAFFCEYRKAVRPMFGALPAESRDILENFGAIR